MYKNSKSKIKTVDELAAISDSLRKKGKKVVHCHGVFDLLHPGHIKHFESAKSKGDVLITTVTQDKYVNKGPGRPVFNQNLRAESIAAIGCVDYVAINEWPTAVETIKRLKPHFYVKGNEYAKKEKDLTGRIGEEEDAVRFVGGAIHFTDDITFSSSTLINSYFTPYPEEAKDFFQKFKQRYCAEDIIGILKKASGLKVLVIGDVIIDEYHYCAGMGKTTKDNIIATKYLNEEIFAGGALAAANHLAGFCQDVTLITALGAENNYSNFIKTRLKSNIKTNLYECKGVPTVVKRRFVDPNFLNKLFEICYLNDKNFLTTDVEDRICAYLKTHLNRFDMVLAADFGHGLITQKIVKILCEKAKFLAVNVQTNSSNIGFNLITKFHKADYICIDEPEIRLACHDKNSDIERLIKQVSKKLKCDKVIITRGHKGSTVYSKKDGFQQIPIFSREILDRIGAGDAYFSITAPCACHDVPMEAVGFIGNAAGAMKVLIVGNRSSVEPVPLYKYITTLLR